MLRRMEKVVKNVEKYGKGSKGCWGGVENISKCNRGTTMVNLKRVVGGGRT